MYLNIYIRLISRSNYSIMNLQFWLEQFVFARFEFLFKFYLLISILLYAYEKYSIWRFKIDHLYKIRQFQLDRFLLKLFGKAILGIKRSISKEIWAKIEWMIIEFQSICELLTWFLLSVKCKRKRKKGKWIVIEILKAIYHYINSWSQLN